MRSSPFALLEGLIAPAPAPARVAFLTRQPFAHRGLHGALRIENSRAAFRAAIAAGHGIELDVQPASDGVPFVFHDDALDRLTRERGRVDERTGAQLDAILLAGTDETLPRLDAVLALIAGRVPVLIEVKHPRSRLPALCLAIRRALEGYGGDAAVMSFDPRIPGWFAEHAPRIVRGLVATDHQRRVTWRGRVARLAALAKARPDFLAWDVRDLPSATTVAARARAMPVLTWTVRDAAGERTAFDHADEAIYERVR